METSPSADTILVASDRSGAFVRVIGRGSFKGSPSLKKFAQAEIEKGCRRLVLDLKDCVGMDSTFMGVIAGLALQLKRLQGTLAVIRLNSKNAALLETLGLSRLLEMSVAAESRDAAGSTAATQPLAMAAEKRETTETMLEAHETLVDVEPGNQMKFKDVLTYLREGLHHLGSPEKGS